MRVVCTSLKESLYAKILAHVLEIADFQINTAALDKMWS